MRRRCPKESSMAEPDQVRPLLELRNVSKTFRQRHGAHVQAALNVSITVGYGETVALVGESGSGKSSLARIALCLHRPDAGEVHFDGQRLDTLGSAALRSSRTAMQPVFQDSTAAFNPRRTVLQSLAQALPDCPKDAAVLERRVSELLEQVQLRPGAQYLQRYPMELSGGQRQRLAIARALAMRPKLIVADEPLSGADVSIRGQVLNLFGDLQRAHGLSYLFITHDISVARAFADRVVVMYRGEVVEQGPAAEVLERPAHEYTRVLLAAVPSLHGTEIPPSTNNTPNTQGAKQTMSTTFTPIGGQAAWKGPQVNWKQEGLHILAPSQLAEIDAALNHLKNLGDLDLTEITQETFPLTEVAKLCERIGDDIRNGRGFAMLRGLPREKYTADDMARIYFGIGAYLGRPLYQSYQGELLGHVMDHSDLEDKPRAYHAGGHIGMHTDSCDIVGLMCLRTAKEGGDSRIASAVAVHDSLVQQRPELASALYRGFFYRRMELDAQYGTGVVVSKNRVPVFTREDEDFACYFLGGYAKRAAKMGDVPLSEVELAAIDEAEGLAGSPEFFLDMNFADGDIQFLNNRRILHGRTDYVEEKELGKRRHLLRLWLRVPSWPKLPADQVFHTDEDHRKWAQQRTPQMELPSRYIDKLRQEQARRLQQPSTEAG
jgi:ABC-type oligopeptide transport system ATPase subunit